MTNVGSCGMLQLRNRCIDWLGTTKNSRRSASFKLNFWVTQASIEGETGSKTLVDKTEEIRNYLLSQPEELGTISNPKAYIDDVAELSFANVETEYAINCVLRWG